MQAGPQQAVVHVNAAVLARPARLAAAQEVVDQVRAVAAVGAGPHLAVVHVDLAGGAHEACHAAALEVVGQVDAGAPVGAGLVGAVVVAVVLARGAEEAAGADALLVDAVTACNT